MEFGRAMYIAIDMKISSSAIVKFGSLSFPFFPHLVSFRLFILNLTTQTQEISQPQDKQNRLTPQGSHTSTHAFSLSCSPFHLTHSSNLTPFPPKISSALPIVKSTFPLLRLLTSSRSASSLPPPAYVTGILHHSASFSTSSWSIPRWRPSTSAAWMRNSAQWGSRRDIDSMMVISRGS